MKAQPITARKRQALALLDGPLSRFIGRPQAACVRHGLRGEEAAFFADKILALDAVIRAMPATYEQDGKGDQATVFLHYFAGGAANWWITEKDKGDGTPDAFGLANLFGGPTGQDAELGYISIEDIIRNGGELDFYFAPQTLAELQGKPIARPAAIALSPVHPVNTMAEQLARLMAI